jgi:hypothetical protein
MSKWLHGAPTYTCIRIIHASLIGLGIFIVTLVAGNIPVASAAAGSVGMSYVIYALPDAKTEPDRK